MKKIKRFLELDPPYTDYKTAKFVVVPVPYEKTVSYGGGTAKGPDAILTASQYVEDYDVELDKETCKVGIAVRPTIKLLNKIKPEIASILKDNKIPVMLGGEHSITPFAVEACVEKYKNLSVLQFDAHADLRDTYHGSKNSHACAIRRVLEMCPAVQVGIRSVDVEEAQFAKKSGQIKNIHFAHKLDQLFMINEQLTDDVYITIDIDALDPSIIPSTGTPEPGGLIYYQMLDILRDVIKNKNVVGFDVVELAPIKGLNHPDFTTAKLIYKLMGYVAAKKGFQAV